MAGITVYTASCMSCGSNAQHMARLTALYGAQNIQLIDTRVLPEKRPEHAQIAEKLELSMDRLKPVVHIEDNGENIYKPLADV